VFNHNLQAGGKTPPGFLPACSTVKPAIMQTTIKNKELTFTRILNAPREMVFDAWTNPVHLARWWGPKDFTNPVCEADARPGGLINIDMTGPDGTLYPVKGVFYEVERPARLVFTNTAHNDKDGIPGLEVLCTVTFEDLGGKTKLVLQSLVVKATPEAATAVAGMETGWNQSLDRLHAVVE
jgi:uncharacterized protein YndB with AHSA1/START domain